LTIDIEPQKGHRLAGSMICVWGVRMPSFSADSIIAPPMRSLTLEKGLKNSSFNSTVACSDGTTCRSFTSDVSKVVYTMRG
jgi:hypothetical protein